MLHVVWNVLGKWNSQGCFTILSSHSANIKFISKTRQSFPIGANWLETEKPDKSEKIKTPACCRHRWQSFSRFTIGHFATSHPHQNSIYTLSEGLLWIRAQKFDLCMYKSDNHPIAQKLLQNNLHPNFREWEANWLGFNKTWQSECFTHLHVHCIMRRTKPLAISLTWIKERSHHCII